MPCALLSLLIAITLQADPTPLLRIGTLVAPVDPSVEAFDGGFRLEAGRGWRPAVTAYVETSPTAPCSVEAMRANIEHDDGEGASRTLDSALTLHWATGWTGCAAMSGRPLSACVRHEGVTTLIRVLDMGCRTPMSGDDRVLAVLSGLRPAD